MGSVCENAPTKNIVYTIRDRIYTIYDGWPGGSCWLFFGGRTVRDVFHLGEFRAPGEKQPNFRVWFRPFPARPISRKNGTAKPVSSTCRWTSTSTPASRGGRSPAVHRR